MRRPQVALFVDDAWFCGGSLISGTLQFKKYTNIILISDEWVMTAAHCADGAGYFDVMGQYITIISPLSHHYLTSISPVSHQYLINISPNLTRS